VYPLPSLSSAQGEADAAVDLLWKKKAAELGQ
jgi:hypothetical protein